MILTYLLIDLGTVILPLLFTFHPKLAFHKHWRNTIPAIALPAVPFIIWDAIFESKGIWGFNSDYLLGIPILNLPLEEVLFFICIPYACLFTYHCMKRLVPIARKPSFAWQMSVLILVFAGAMAVLFFEQSYTATVFVALATSLIAVYLLFRPRWMARFYITYAILMLPFFVVNGLLTGTWLENPVVWYNEREIIRLRLGTIPVEDVFYGLLLFLWNVAIFEFDWKSSKNG